MYVHFFASFQNHNKYSSKLILKLYLKSLYFLLFSGQGMQMTKSPPVSGHHQQMLPQPAPHGSITQGTPLRPIGHGQHPGANLPPQARMSGSITSGTPVNRDGSSSRQPEPGVRVTQAGGVVFDPRFFDPRHVEQMKAYPGTAYPPYALDPASSSTRQMMNDFQTARQMQRLPEEREPQISPRAKETMPPQQKAGYGPGQILHPFQTSQGMVYLPPGQVQQPGTMSDKGQPSPHHMGSRGGTPHEEKLSPGGWNLSKPVGSPNVMRSITQGTGKPRPSVIAERRQDSYPADSSSQPRSQPVSPRQYQDLQYQGGMSRTAQQQEYQKMLENRERMERIEAENRRIAQVEERERERQKKLMIEEKMRKEAIKEEQSTVSSKPDSPWSSNRASPAYNKGQIKEATDILKVFRTEPSPPTQTGPISRHQGLTAANLIDAIIVHQINQVDEGNAAAGKENAADRKKVETPPGSSAHSGLSEQKSPSQVHGKKKWIQEHPQAMGQAPQRPPQQMSKPPTTEPQRSAPMPGGGGSSSHDGMETAPRPPSSAKTLGEHINSIILMDYNTDKVQTKESVLGRINGSSNLPGKF